MRILDSTPVLILVLGVALTAGIREQSAVDPKAPMVNIPSEFEGMAGHDLTVPEDERRIAGMSDYVLREFGGDSSKAFSVYVGYYDRQVQGKSIHSPKNCLPGAGWEIMSASRIPLRQGSEGAQSINRVVLSNRGARALVYYWYQGRGRTEASEYMVKWNLLRDAAIRGRTEESLVRIVIPYSSESELIARDSLAGRVIPWLHQNVQALMP